MMLCESCQHQATCLLPQLATHDRQVQTLLDKLQACEMYLARFPMRLWRWEAIGASCSDAVRRLWAWGQAQWTRAAAAVRRYVFGIAKLSLTQIFKDTVCHWTAAKH